MDGFNFTKKKFLTLDPQNRHRHVMAWLTGTYQKLTANRVTQPGLEQIFSRYRQVLSWMEIRHPGFPGPGAPRQVLEFLSDAIHFHRTRAGQYPKDHDLLEPETGGTAPLVHTGDLESRQVAHPVLEYHLALDGLRSVFNIGSIFRTCDAAGFASVILGNTPGKEHPKVQKTAMGAHQWVLQEKTDDLAGLLLAKKREGFPIIGIETMPQSLSIHETPWPAKAILVLGNEEYGISSHVSQICDTFAHIPMYGRKNSLNVGCAVAAVCFHIRSVISTRPQSPG